MSNSYLLPLPQNETLNIFNNDNLIFSNNGKWLNPLFDFEEFLKTYTGDKDNLSAHDTAIGKAAVVLMIKSGIKKIYGNLVSKLAIEYVNQVNSTATNYNDTISISYGCLVDRLLCATEEQLAPLTNIEQMYFLLRQRSKRVQGIAVNVENLCSPYGFIQNFNINLNAGDRLLILGENGIGKTTLLKLLAGIDKPLSGTILLDNKPLSQLPKFTIGYIPQQTDNVQYCLSVSEVTGLGIDNKLYKTSKNKTQIIHNALERTSCMHLINRNFATLSGGEKQKVSIARCLAQNAKLLLLDEPTAALDTQNKQMVMDILRSLSLTEIPTIIIVTHDIELTNLNGWKILKIESNLNTRANKWKE